MDAQNINTSTSSDGKEITFHYEDLENFRVVMNVAKARGDTLQAMKDYFLKASEGMKGWIARYNKSPEEMVRAVRYFPKYYNYLTQLDTMLVQYEKPISEGLKGLKELFPSDFVHLPPVYYFVLFGGGGSVELTANMISLDYFGYYDGIDESEFDKIGGLFPEGNFHLVKTDLIPQIAIHEAAHLLQVYMQGVSDYRSIYTGEKTMKAFAVREGGADFLTALGSGIIDKKRHEYGDAHERDLWELFEPVANESPDAHPGWFSGQSTQNPDWPWQIGYYLGYKMVEYYYLNTEDKQEAIRFILNSHRASDFDLILKLYAEKWKN